MKLSGDFPEKSVKPFRISRTPAWPLTGEQLEADQENAEQNYADILGCSLFQQRDDVLSTFSALAEDKAYRAKLGAANTAPFISLHLQRSPQINAHQYLRLRN